MRKQSIREMAVSLRNHIEQASLASPFDFPTPELRRKVDEAFILWAECWLSPIAENLAARAKIPCPPAILATGARERVEAIKKIEAA